MVKSYKKGRKIMGELYRYGEKVKLELPSVDVGDSDPN